MAWKETEPMFERALFVQAVLAGEGTFAGLCRQFGVSRKTGYKWLERYEAEGAQGLLERSRAPLHLPNMTCPEMEAAILRLRRKWGWGPKKLAKLLAADWSAESIPSQSTIGDILKRNGLVAPRKLRRHCTPSSEPLGHAVESNLVWCADFKGWFHTGNGQRVDPLTVTDAYSRYLLACQGMRGKTDTEHVLAVFETLFRSYGLPERIRTDNGPPFASTGLAGLSRLSVWWMRLDIVPERIDPGKPQQNGRHERFHRTLKAETATPAAHTPRKQQQAFDAFQEIYNNERPHEALGQEVPASRYASSPRSYPERLPQPAYDDDMVTRRVRGAGQMQWGGKDVLVSQALRSQTIGLQPVEDGIWRVYFCKMCIGLFDERALRIKRLKKGKGKDSSG
jgi:transposase InsO family protein